MAPGNLYDPYRGSALTWYVRRILEYNRRGDKWLRLGKCDICGEMIRHEFTVDVGYEAPLQICLGCLRWNSTDLLYQEASGILRRERRERDDTRIQAIREAWDASPKLCSAVGWNEAVLVNKDPRSHADYYQDRIDNMIRSSKRAEQLKATTIIEYVLLRL